MSRIRLIPPTVELFPNQKQTFLVESSPPPAYWFGITNVGTIDANFAMVANSGQPSVLGNGALKLYSGIGLVEWTFDNQFMPSSTGTFNVTAAIADVSGFTYLYRVTFSTTQITIQDEALATLATLAYVPIAGDRFWIELSNGFRLWHNGVLRNSRVGLATQTVYPMSYLANLIKPTINTASRVPAMRLVGEGWRLSETATFTAPIHGSISTVGPALETIYSGGTTPGTYTLTAQVEPGADVLDVQLTTATIIIPPLKILSPPTVTFQPSAKGRFKTNYPDNLVAWSVAAGSGSFSQGEFTAGSAPGTAKIRATASVNSSVAEIIVSVPAVITNAANLTAAKASEQIDFNTNMTGTITWSASIGSINSSSGLWTAPSQTGQTAIITATNGTLTTTLEIDVLEEFPFNRVALPWSLDYDKRALVGESEDGSGYFSRVKSGARRSFEVNLLACDLTDLGTIRTFWDGHHPGKSFIWQDPEESIRLVLRTDSALRWEHSDNGINIAFRVKQA